MAKIGVKIGRLRKMSISISEESADWIEANVESQRYRNISHAFESLIREKKANETNESLIREKKAAETSV